jgi:hypothetical protein
VLFALQGDLKQPQIRGLAQKILTEEAEKRPDMIRQLFSEVSKCGLIIYRDKHFILV